MDFIMLIGVLIYTLFLAGKGITARIHHYKTILNLNILSIR